MVTCVLSRENHSTLAIVNSIILGLIVIGIVGGIEVGAVAQSLSRVVQAVCRPSRLRCQQPKKTLHHSVIEVDNSIMNAKPKRGKMTK